MPAWTSASVSTPRRAALQSAGWVMCTRGRRRLALLATRLGVDAPEDRRDELGDRHEAISEEDLAFADGSFRGRFETVGPEHSLVQSRGSDEDLVVLGEEDRRGQPRASVRLDVDHGDVLHRA